MTTSSDTPERRLRPLSFLFTLLAQLRQFIFPLVAAFFFGSSGGKSQGDEYVLIGVAIVSLGSLAQYFTYRYRIEKDAVVVRSGVFERSLRHIPFSRIQNVSLQQNVLHRLFGVAEVRLESAGAAKPEAQMRVLRLSDAHELEAQIHAGARLAGHGPGIAGDDAGAGLAPPTRELLALPTSEVLRLGLVSNRGMLIAALAFGGVAQLGNNVMGKLLQGVGTWIYGHAEAWHLSWFTGAAAAMLLVLLGLAGLQLLSMVWALLKFHGFRLSEVGTRLSAESGLFTRVRASLPRRRIQAWTLHEGLVHRWFKRRSLKVDSAVVENGMDKRALRELAPIATPAKIDELVASLLPPVRGTNHAAWPVAEWQPLHPNAWRRRFLWPAAIVTLVSISISLIRWPSALWLLLLVPVFWWSARNWARNSGWSVRDGLVAFRGGWLSKHWRFAEVRKLQALEWQQSPFDRRWGMATLHFDTAGAGGEPELHIPYLPEATARRLYDELAVSLEK